MWQVETLEQLSTRVIVLKVVQVTISCAQHGLIPILVQIFPESIIFEFWKIQAVDGVSSIASTWIPRLDQKPAAILAYPLLFKSVPGHHRSGTTQRLGMSRKIFALKL
jgi:hypothetical protein